MQHPSACWWRRATKVPAEQGDAVGRPLAQVHRRAFFQNRGQSSEAAQRQVSLSTCLTVPRVVVVLENRIYVYNFADLRLIDAIDTCNNPRGLCALNPDSNYAVLATPDREQGQVRITIFEKKINQVIQAHQNALYALALSA
jgi:hypothetical protein